jgi:hypothetical protein
VDRIPYRRRPPRHSDRGRTEVARQYNRAGEALFGEAAHRDGFARGMESVVIHMRGAALTGILRRSDKDDDTIAECLAIMRTALADQR